MLDMVALWTLGALQLTFESQGGSEQFTMSEMVSTTLVQESLLSRDIVDTVLAVPFCPIPRKSWSNHGL